MASSDVGVISREPYLLDSVIDPFLVNSWILAQYTITPAGWLKRRAPLIDCHRVAHDIDERVVSYVRQAFGRQITVRLDRIPDPEKRDPDVIGPCEPSKFPGQLVIGLLVAPAGSAVARVPAFMLHFGA